jgi:hypothetical protein
MKKNSVATQTAVTETVKPAALPWDQKVLKAIQWVEDSFNRTKADFMTAMEKEGPAYAIRWRSEALTKTEQQFALLKPMREFLTATDETEYHKIRLVLKEIEKQRKYMSSGFRISQSTPFQKAVEDAQTEAKFGMFSEFHGVFAEIEQIASKAMTEVESMPITEAGK